LIRRSEKVRTKDLLEKRLPTWISHEGLSLWAVRRTIEPCKAHIVELIEVKLPHETWRLCNWVIIDESIAVKAR
jgi:hypothetical protein